MDLKAGHIRLMTEKTAGVSSRCQRKPIAALEQCRDRGRRQVSIDGRIVGSLAAETFLAQPLYPGTHVISFFNNTSQENTEVTVEAGKNYFLRVGMNPAATSNRARMKLVPENEGRELVRTNSLVQSLLSGR